MQKISRTTKLRAFALLLALGLISSCASQQADDLPGQPTSEASLLDESDTATPVSDESAIFADLNAQPADGEGATDVAASTDAVDVSSDDSPFYNPVGGESLGRVAYTLFGDRKQAGALLSKNPELSGVKSLAADQRVYFDFAQVRPMPTFLTKDLIDRYPSELASRIEETAGLGKQSVTLAPGETLQELSMRLYGTTRYWTEIYLLNRSAIPHYDKVQAGLSLTVYQRAAVATSPSTPSQVQEPTAVAATQAAEPPKTENPRTAEDAAPTPAPSAPPAVDPIPETPDYGAAAQPQNLPEVTQASPPPTAEAAAAMAEGPTKSFIDWSNSANTRRVIYIALILLIGCVAFYMTRSPKKKNFDMLDVTTSDTAGARSKLKDADSHHQEIG